MGGRGESLRREVIGERGGTRTLDLMIKSQVWWLGQRFVLFITTAKAKSASAIEVTRSNDRKAEQRAL